MVHAAIAAGATHVGFVHFANSPRHVTLEQAAALRRAVPARVKAVLLLVNADAATTGNAIDLVKPNVIQFHGKETPEWLRLVRQQTGIETWRAIGVRSAETLENSRRFVGAADRLLFDAPPPEAQGSLPGGNGVGFDWRLLKGHDHPIPWGLAGGLDPTNVAEAIRATGAPLVDASSGLESAPGIKDVDKIVAFCEAARSV
jgi:phosphoribosylanthranilate isomerase